MALEIWILFCLTEIVVSLSPGPVVVLISSMGMSQGRASALHGTLGVIAASGVYFAISATGLAVLITSSWETFLLIKYLGAAYLIWLGFDMIWGTFRKKPTGEQKIQIQQKGKSFWKGFVTEGANPKALIFFTAIVPQFINYSTNVSFQIFILAITSFVIEFLVLQTYGILAAQAGKKAKPVLKKALDRVGGGLLIAAGAGLAGIKNET